jgi:tRNA (guanine-N7-)-methyltransferase
MRLRNKPQAEPYIKEDKKYYIHNLKDIKDKKVFNNKKPLYVEIGMGKGGFIFENAKQNKDINYIGLELYPTILYVALKKYYEQDEELDNLRITELDARDLLETFGPKSVDKILLTFSDP